MESWGNALEQKGGGDSPPCQWKMVRHENNTEMTLLGVEI